MIWIIVAFVWGFSIATFVFYPDIKLGIQVRREAEKKLKEKGGGVDSVQN